MLSHILRGDGFLKLCLVDFNCRIYSSIQYTKILKNWDNFLFCAVLKLCKTCDAKT